MYRPTYTCPPKAEASLVSQIAKLSTLAKSLDDAMSDLIKENNNDDENTITKDERYDDKIDDDDDQHLNNNSKQQDSNVSDIGSLSSGDERSNVEIDDTDNCDLKDISSSLFNDQFKKTVLQKFGDAQATITTSQQHDSLANHDEYMQSSNSNGIKEAPAALLHGNLKYYNRINGQWRIVVGNAVLRPRVNIDYGKKNKKRNCTSLWDQSKQTSQHEGLRFKRGRIDGDQIQKDFPLDDDGAIPLNNGDLVILAYDDVL